LSLALFALDDAEPASEFCLRTLNFGRPTPIMGHVLDIIVVSHVAVAGMMCDESGEACKYGFTASCKGPLLHFLGCDTAGL
jgi:hypothetical protein